MRRPICARSTPPRLTGKSSGSFRSAGIAIIFSLLTLIAPSHGDQPHRLAAPDMDHGPKLPVDQSDRLVAILAIHRPQRREDEVIVILQHPHAEGERNTVLLSVRFVLGRIEID